MRVFAAFSLCLCAFVVITIIRHYVRKHNVEYLKDQIYLEPHPDELKLLNQL
jgi:uncharacterized protein YbgA (DUF1722 family)